MTPQNVGSSVAAAAHLVAALIAGGVRDVVVCPGSRSAPLAYALYQAEADGAVRLHVRHDERTAAFVALGCGKADPAHPAAVVTTSGSAAANLMPAAIEARHAGVGLLLITADRPPRLRGTWANQTSDLQAGLFAQVAVHSVDHELATLSESGIATMAAHCLHAAHRGPVHLNVCFDEPLQPHPGDVVALPEVQLPPLSDPRASTPGEVVELPLGPRTLVIAGDGAGTGARRLATQAGWPLLAEPSSMSRGGPTLVFGYRNLLPRNGFAERVKRVVVFGRPTLSRPVTRLVNDPEVRLVHVVRQPDEPGPGRPVRRVAGDVTVSGLDVTNHGWLEHWVSAGTRYAARMSETLAGWPRLTGPAVGAAVVAATSPSDALVLGASNPIRDVDLAAGAVADGALVVANRGLAGIDGTLSTAIGIATATGRPTRLFVGDLTFLHDVTALAVPAPERARLQLQIVVLNDDGGGIFATLEHGQHPTQFERVFGTPTGADLGQLAAGLGAGHRRVDSADALRHALADVRPGLEIVEVAADRSNLRALHATLSQL